MLCNTIAAETIADIIRSRRRSAMVATAMIEPVGQKRESLGPLQTRVTPKTNKKTCVRHTPTCGFFCAKTRLVVRTVTKMRRHLHSRLLGGDARRRTTQPPHQLNASSKLLSPFRQKCLPDPSGCRCCSPLAAGGTSRSHNRRLNGRICARPNHTGWRVRHLRPK